MVPSSVFLEERFGGGEVLCAAGVRVYYWLQLAQQGEERGRLG